jgi:short-chain Z-isoprenyl diphosphate synthase
MELLPKNLVDQLNDVASKTKGIKGVVINVAIGYGGRSEIADAVKSLITSDSNIGKSAAEIASSISVEEISRHLYTAGLPDPDLVIRTSGEQRLGGFLLWQSAHSEFYFCEAYWPDFRRVDFLRAIRAYSQRNRRFGK